MGEQTVTDEAKDLDKFTKFLALKSAQIIVQSRLGEKIRTPCKPFSPDNKDWFYLAVDDLPEVLERTKCALGNSCSDTPPLTLCVEISLRTVEGDTMVLEVWHVGVDSSQRDPSVRVAYTVYNRMGILLKSLVSVSRVTPAYKLSRRQGPDSYLISYRIYIGEPQYHLLGEGYKQAKVGQLGTPAGTIQLTCYFRTKMTISPQPSKESSMILKSDHFMAEFSPKHSRSIMSDDTSDSMYETIKVGAFVGPMVLKEEEDIRIPFACLLKSTDSKQKKNDEISSSSNPPPPSDPVPVSLSKSKEDSDNGNVSEGPLSNEDFIMKFPPFASTCNPNDLGHFYLECHSAPKLEAFSSEPTLSEQVGDLTSQLAAYETSLEEYDNVITELCGSENNN